jgi:hypothetical protein
MYRVLPRVGLAQATTAPVTTAPGAYCINSPRLRHAKRTMLATAFGALPRTAAYPALAAELSKPHDETLQDGFTLEISTCLTVSLPLQ